MTPRHDSPTGEAVELAWSEARGLVLRIFTARRRRSMRRPGQPGADPCPVTPNHPLDLSGGAAAALEFDA
ncbi:MULTISPECIES: hypothetical protein [unclassified Sphingomonas]|jgi:hypothetical protein|uniref:hypothetical protein n=1 Tax=unclassified Sphingomonas TaxID=196159 RepID=UPI000E10B9F1|nr:MULTISPECIES: hypothetical protein [unclassified Sphingomonas]AXJ94724.1 hypothetical protein DM480_03645 [Sphingomonas sp. FARSPH]